MQRWLTILTVVLAVQVVVTLGLWLGGDQETVASQGKPLAQFSPDSVEAVEITGSDGGQVRIERGDDGWQIPAADGFPAAQSDIESLMEALNGFDDRLPVARSEGARERFRVAEGQFERRLRLIGSDGPVATILFGQSAGPDRVYARAADASMIYEVGFALRQASADAADWYDRAVAGVSMADVTEVRLPEFRLRRGEASSEWLALADGGEVQPAARGKATQLLGRVAQPALEGVARGEAPERAPDLNYSITTREGEAIRFAYYRNEGDETVHLYRSDQPWRYGVSQETFDRLAGQSVDALLPGQSKSAGQGQGQDGSPEASGS